jgi:hypothetical protein
MKKKDYQKPTMRVVMLQQRSQLLASSGSESLQDYNWNDYTDE